MSKHRNAALLCGAAFLGFLALPAHADNRVSGANQLDETVAPADTGGASQGNGIETVVVTAQKREENIQNVPIAMTALTGADLERQGIKGFQDLSFNIPSLRFSPDTEGGENSITLRGIANVNVVAGGDSPVAYLVDGVYMGRTTSIDPEFFDVDRVEVLRGPQGTLYGRNSIGGSVDVVTNHPTDELGGHVDALFGNYNARIFRGWANVPLIDSGGAELDFRVVAVAANHDGYQKNLDTAPTATHNADGENYKMVRAELLYKPSANFDLLLTAAASTNKDPPAFKFEQQWMPGDRYTVNGAIPNPTNPREVYKDYPEILNQWNHSANATANWRFGGMMLTSITGWEQGYWNQTGDDDGSNLNMAFQKYWNVAQEQYTEEIHLTSTNDASPLKWIAGFFYFHERNIENFDYSDSGLGFIPYAYVAAGTLTTDSWAPFGQIDYDLGKTSMGIPLTITVGARYSADTKKGNDSNQILAFGVNASEVFNYKWNRMTPKATVSYKASDDLMLYATASEGYLAGGKLLSPNSGYNPEYADSLEAGFKSQWFDNRLQFDASAFLTKLTNQQVFVLTPFTTTIQNAAKSHINGFEMEAVAIPIDGLRLDATLSVMDARYDKYITLDNRFAPPTPANFSGHYLVQTPPYSLGVGAEYTFNTSFGTITPRVQTFFSGQVYLLSDNAPQDRQAPYTRTNLSLTWTDASNRWSAEAFVENLENNNIISQDGIQSANQTLIGQAYDALIYYPPRTFGVRVNFNFGG